MDQDDFGGLWAERLFSLIERLPAYDGAVAARIAKILEDAQNHAPGGLVAPGGSSSQGTVRQADSSTGGLRSNPVLSDWIQVDEV